MTATASALQAWMRAQWEADLLAATSGANSPLTDLQSQIGAIMASLADIQTILAQETAVEQKMVALLQSQAATISTLKDQLSQGGTDQGVIQTVVSQMQDNVNNLNAAITALTPASPSQPGTPVVNSGTTDAGPITAPGAPQIS